MATAVGLSHPGTAGKNSKSRTVGVFGPLARTMGRLLAGLGLVAGILAVAYPLAIRPWHLRWGATELEVGRPLPGDHLVPNPVVQATRAITINAQPGDVWPWLVQMGQGRGGLYSYDDLENLVGCDIHSADRVEPDLQELRVGDVIRLVPRPYVFAGMRTEEGPSYSVAEIHPNRALILTAPPAGAPKADGGFRTTWSFVLERIDDSSTRLLVRTRSFSDPGWLAPVVGVEPIHFFMEQKMLRGIKERVEANTVR